MACIRTTHTSHFFSSAISGTSRPRAVTLKGNLQTLTEQYPHPSDPYRKQDQGRIVRSARPTKVTHNLNALPQASFNRKEVSLDLDAQCKGEHPHVMCSFSVRSNSKLFQHDVFSAVISSLSLVVPIHLNKHLDANRTSVASQYSTYPNLTQTKVLLHSVMAHQAAHIPEAEPKSPSGRDHSKISRHECASLKYIQSERMKR